MNQNDDSLYANCFGFLRLPLVFDPVHSDADVVITGVPFDLATTGRSGARMGPSAIRQASVNLAWESPRWPWPFKLSDKLSMVDGGDLVFECGNAEQMSERLQNHASTLLKAGKKLFYLGGDHFISLPLLRAHAKQHGPMALLHFDAHTDTYSAGGRYDHGTMFYHAAEENLVVPSQSLQIGIRTHGGGSLGYGLIDAAEANDLTVDELAQRVYAQVKDLPVYLTFDIDCLDPAFAPGTGTPVCGGMTTDKIMKLLRKLKDLNIVGMDLVEVSPAYDQSEITALAGATLTLEMLHLWAARS